MIVRIRRSCGLDLRMGRQFTQPNLHRRLQLGVVTLAHRLWILLDRHVRVDSVILHIPLARGRKERDARRGDVPAVHEDGNFADADQAAPGPLADQSADLRLLEQPGKRIAAGAGDFVRYHHFGPVDGGIRGVLDFAVAGRPIRFDVAAQDLHDVIGHLPAAVEALVDDRALLLSLREVIAVEIGEAFRTGVRQVYVGKFSAGHLLHLAPIGLDPIDVAQGGLAGDGHDGDVAHLAAVGCRDAQRDRMLGRTFERLLDVHRGGQLLSVDRENAIARAQIEPGLRQGRLFAGIEFSSRVDFREAVAVAPNDVVGAEQAAGYSARPGYGAAAAP